MFMQDREVLSLFDDWNKALKTLDSSKVVELYADNAVLLPTLSNSVRHNHSEIQSYFESFLMKQPQGSIDESNIRIFSDVVIHSGIYTFEFKNADSERHVKCRFTFVYGLIDGSWKILEHHSSAMPE